MTLENISKWDPTDYLKTPEEIGLFIAAAFEENNPRLVLWAIEASARASGMVEFASLIRTLDSHFSDEAAP